MTTDDPDDLVGRTADPGVERDVVEQYWNTMARTADLVRKLTSLADRYDTTGHDDDPQAEDRRQRVALMRSTAESGRRLIRSAAPPALPQREQPPRSPLELTDRALMRDVLARDRDAAAQARDERATARDIRVRGVAGDEDPDVAARFLAACDRDAAAGDRADALADRRAAQQDRGRTAPPPGLDSQARTYALITQLEECAVIRQAQGILMQRAGLTAGEAFEALLLAANEGPLTLEGVADHVVRRAELPSGHDVR